MSSRNAFYEQLTSRQRSTIRAKLRRTLVGYPEWMDPTHEDVDAIAAQYGVSPDAIWDIWDTRQRLLDLLDHKNVTVTK